MVRWLRLSFLLSFSKVSAAQRLADPVVLIRNLFLSVSEWFGAITRSDGALTMPVHCPVECRTPAWESQVRRDNSTERLDVRAALPSSPPPKGY